VRIIVLGESLRRRGTRRTAARDATIAAVERLEETTEYTEGAEEKPKRKSNFFLLFAVLGELVFLCGLFNAVAVLCAESELPSFILPRTIA